jgi:hypothetical protein
MSKTRKQISERDMGQATRLSFNDVDASVTSSDFLVGVVGRRKDYAIITTNVANDTVRITYSENGTNLYVIDQVYTSGARTQLLFERRVS